MALTKTGINIPFGQGIDTKTDPNQVPMGKMIALENVVFDNGGQLHKRNGYKKTTTLPVTTNTTLTTLNNNLIATGSSLYSFNADTNQWYNRGLIKPVDLQALPLVRNSLSQTAVDTAVASNGLVCSVFKNGTTASYQINDATTGQILQALVALPSSSALPRVLVLGQYFVITFLRTIGPATHIEFIAIPLNNPTNPGAAVDLSSQVKTITAGYDIVVANNTMYIAFNASDGGGAIRIIRVNSMLASSAVTVLAGINGDLISLAADTTNSTPVIWLTYWDDATNNMYTRAFNSNIGSILGATLVTNSDIARLTSTASGNINTIAYEVNNTYSFSATVTQYITSVTVTSAGVVGTPAVVIRAMGLASKPILYNDVIYFVGVYGQTYQPTYFLIDISGNVYMKLAYSNGGGFLTNQILPSISVIDTNLYFPYLFKDLLASVNKTQGVANVSGIYTQTGINLARININIDSQLNSEIAGALHLTGGFLWEFDAIKPVEHGFHVWPEDLVLVPHTTGGSMSDQTYFYKWTYEWTDAQGMLHRSAPSVPMSAVVSGGGGSGSVTVNIPTLRQTYKTSANPVRLVGYRWSTAQQNYYQITSITSPTLNNPTVDSIAYLDTATDASILGNNLIYTTGGVIENIAAPASSGVALFKSRLFSIDAENKNVLWYSKQVIQDTPVEMSDLFTIFVAPSTGAQGSTGDITAISAMDDKLIIFKRDAIYYVTGTGPDNTGGNNDFSDPIFITSTAGCENAKSIVFMPMGIMFQSDKGIWLLGRDLSTKYIGADVESYNNDACNSALTIPGTNQVRFSLDSGVTLMYDYYYNQWGTFNGVSGISATLFDTVHTYLNEFGQILKETPEFFLDNTSPVLIKFTTAWMKLTNLQGFQRAYFFFLLGTYLTPHRLGVNIAYNYDPSIRQRTLISPTNFSPAYGGDSLYGGGSVWGGPSNVEQWRVFLNQQKCQSVQISINEIFDSTKGVAAGLGLTLSGINMVIGGKLGYPKLAASEST